MVVAGPPSAVHCSESGLAVTSCSVLLEWVGFLRALVACYPWLPSGNYQTIYIFNSGPDPPGPPKIGRK